VALAPIERDYFVLHTYARATSTCYGGLFVKLKTVIRTCTLIVLPRTVSSSSRDVAIFVTEPEVFLDLRSKVEGVLILQQGGLCALAAGKCATLAVSRNLLGNPIMCPCIYVSDLAVREKLCVCAVSERPSLGFGLLPNQLFAAAGGKVEVRARGPQCAPPELF